MRRAVMLCLPLILAGCQAGNTPAPVDSGPARPSVQHVGDPATLTPTAIALAGEQRFVQVGMTAEEAFKAFPRTAGYEFSQNPPQFDDRYRSQHWEDGRQHGFGVILFRNLVVAAMYQEENVTQDRVNDFVKRHTDRLGEPSATVSGKHVNYWFWEKDGQRLMIAAFAPQPTGIQLTAAMGDDVVMNGIDATVAHAEDAKRLSEPVTAPPVLANPASR